MGLLKLKEKLITFIAYTEMVEAAECTPVPASTMMPLWYKQLPRYVNNSDKPIKALGSKDLKMCFPFRDALISGYILRLPADVEVTISADNETDFFWNPALPFNVVEKRGSTLDKNKQGYGMPVPHGCSPIMFAWQAFYSWGVPFNYSILVTHPLNRHDLPFVTTSGIMETGKGFDTMSGQIPFFIKEGFTGVIPKGTPIAQLIPYKRENWINKILPRKDDERIYQKGIALRDSVLAGWYGTFVRQPKSYK